MQTIRESVRTFCRFMSEKEHQLDKYSIYIIDFKNIFREKKKTYSWSYIDYHLLLWNMPKDTGFCHFSKHYFIFWQFRHTCIFRIKVKYTESCCALLLLVSVFSCTLDSVFLYKVTRTFSILMSDFLVRPMRNSVYVCSRNPIKKNMYKCRTKSLMLGCWRSICK